MIINEMAGSGGDALPWMFQNTGIGPLIGKRTWGGLVGHYTIPADLLDGGFTGTPNLAFYNPNGTWDLQTMALNRISRWNTIRSSCAKGTIHSSKKPSRS